LSGRENEPTIWLAFFDGEEALVRWSNTDGLYGSRHMANGLFKTGDLARVKAMILLDMVGDRDLSIEWESNSTSWLRRIIWSSARKLRYGEYFTERARRITDDHVPFLSYGIPSIDIIDFHYGPKSRNNEYWHTSEDTLDKVSATSLKVIGDVVLKSIDPIIEHVRRESLGLPSE
jgi:Zn-dependent M28 family amino/carboxypeptidase